MICKLMCHAAFALSLAFSPELTYEVQATPPIQFRHTTAAAATTQSRFC